MSFVNFPIITTTVDDSDVKEPDINFSDFESQGLDVSFATVVMILVCQFFFQIMFQFDIN